MIPNEQQNLIAKYIASKIMIERRNFISQISRKDIEKSVNSIDKMELLFDDTNPQ